jgi:hypothetical protein
MSTPCSRTRAAIFHHLRDTTADRLPADIIVVWLVLITLHDDRDSLARLRLNAACSRLR